MTVTSGLFRVRGVLDENVFPDAPASPKVTSRRLLVLLGLGVAGIIVQLARMWTSAPLNSIWAEDGATWLHDAIDRSVFDNLTTPYNGYLQTLSRLVAEPVARLPVEWYAATMAVAGAAIVTGCAFIVWRASANHIRSPYLRGALAAMFVLLPIVGSETLDNVTNSIWFLLAACFWLLLWRPSSFATAIGAACLLFLGAVTNAGIVLFLPLWILRLVAIRDRRDAVILVGFAVGVAVQFGISWNELGLRGEAGARVHGTPAAAGLPFSAAPYWDWNLVPAYAQRIVGGALTGQKVTGYLWEQIGTPFVVLLGGALVAFTAFAIAVKDSRTRVLVPLAVGISLATFLVAGYRRWGAGGFAFHWPNDVSNTAAAHYMVTPTLLLLSALFIQLDTRAQSLSATAWTRLQTGVVLSVVILALTSFNVADSKTRGSPSWSDALDAARRECIHRGTATVDVRISPPLGFSLPLRCSRL